MEGSAGSASPREVIADLAVTLALGGDCLADIAALRAEPQLFGPVASDPVVSPADQTGSQADRPPENSSGPPPQATDPRSRKIEARERARPYRSRCRALRTNDLGRYSLVCWARPGTMANGMIRSTSATYGRWLAYSSLAIIPEPERPRRRHVEASCRVAAVGVSGCWLHGACAAPDA